MKPRETEKTGCPLSLMPAHEGEEAGLSARLAPAFCLPDALVTGIGARLPEIGSNGGRRRSGTVAPRLTHRTLHTD